MKKIKNAVIVYAEAIRWIASKNYMGTASKDKPVILMDEDGYQSFCQPSIVGRHSVKLNYWYKIEKVPSNDKYNFPFEVLRIVPGSGLSPEEYAKKNISKPELRREVKEQRDWSSEILELLKNSLVLQHKQIHTKLTENTKHYSDYEPDEEKSYAFTHGLLKKLHREGKIYCVKFYRQEQEKASPVFFGLDPDALLELLEDRKKPVLKEVELKKQERINMWGKLGG